VYEPDPSDIPVHLVGCFFALGLLVAAQLYPLVAHFLP